MEEALPSFFTFYEFHNREISICSYKFRYTMQQVVRNNIHFECICGLYGMAIGACSFARNRADSGRASGSEHYEKIAATPEGWAGSRCCRRTSGCRAVACCAGSTSSAATIRWRCRACRSRSSRPKAASSHCESRDHRVSKRRKVLQALGKPKTFGRRDFSRRPFLIRIL